MRRIDLRVCLLPSLLTAVVLSSCSAHPGRTRTRFERYMAASNAHDLKTLAAMTDPDIVWQLGPYRLVGTEAALGPHYTDMIMHTTLTYRDVRIRGDTVEGVLIERNDATRAFGSDSLIRYPRYVFRLGLMWRKEIWKASPSMADFTRRQAPFRAWLRRFYPDAFARLRPDSITGPFREAHARLYSEFLQKWVQAGRPGG